jgi:hypothetical protein
MLDDVCLDPVAVLRGNSIPRNTVRQLYMHTERSASSPEVCRAGDFLGIKSTLAQRGGRRAARGVQATARRSRPVRIRMRSVQELEALVNERFKVELEEVQDERDRLYERVSQCLELKNNMTMLQDQKRSSLKTMVDLGCNFYVQARMCAQPSRAAPCALDRPA